MEDPEHVFHLNSLLAAVLACLVLQFAIGLWVSRRIRR